METYVVGFKPPFVGMDGEFNTIRMGGAYAKRVKVGDVVFLLNERDRLVFGRAEITAIDVALLGEICLVHAEANHTELGNKDGQSSARLFALVQKFYGPHIAKVDKKATVLYLRRLHDDETETEWTRRCADLRAVPLSDGELCPERAPELPGMVPD